jgi:4-amino-4-deoxy-L-arabinose transferase-like glycosyltransferase
MVLSAAGVALLYLWGKEAISRRAGVFAAVAYGFVPTTFYHAHLDCFDAPIATLWLLVAYTYWQSLHGAPTRRSAWAIATGLAFGLAFASKHNSWFLPIAFVAHTLVARGRGLLDDLRRDAVSLPKALVWMALLGPLVLVATWPLLWWDGAARFAFYVRFHLQHEYYNMEYLGRTYFAPPMPLGYAWTMTAATVPTVTLLATVAGLVRALAGLFDGNRLPRDDARTRDTTRLWLIALLVNYLAWFSPQTPIFGGTKHGLTAYPFLCLFAARGFEACAATLERALSPDAHASVHASSQSPPLGRLWLSVTLLVAVLAAPVVESLRAHPWGLSAYTPLVGGAPGAADLGLNRGFWGYQTGAVLDVLNELPRHATVYLHDTTYESFQMLQRDGRLRGDLRATWSPAQADAALYHHEQHMAGVEQQIWVTMGTVAPRVVRGLDGVPIVWVYVRGAR